MRKLKNGATVICEVPLKNSPGFSAVLCDWNGKSVSWIVDEDDYAFEGYYHGAAVPGFLRRSGLESLNGWTDGVAS